MLDIGHLWTVPVHGQLASAAAGRILPPSSWTAFPMERVVEIHVAGLAEFANPSAGAIDGDAQPLPYWIDAHGTPIPGVLFDLLDQVLADPGLTSLKGVALEADTKPIEMIVEEFRQFRNRFESTVHQMVHRGHLDLCKGSSDRSSLRLRTCPIWTQEEQGALQQQYRTYAHLSSRRPMLPCSDVSLLGGSLDDLTGGRDSYLPHELVHWGGDLPDMFPATCGALSRPMSLWSDLCRSGSAGQDPSRRTMIFPC